MSDKYNSSPSGRHDNWRPQFTYLTTPPPTGHRKNPSAKVVDIPIGERIVITEIHPKDAYYDVKEQWLNKVVEAVELYEWLPQVADDAEWDASGWIVGATWFESDRYQSWYAFKFRRMQ